MPSAEYYLDAGLDIVKDGMKIINPPKAATPTTTPTVPSTNPASTNPATSVSSVTTYLPYIAGAAVLFFLLRGKK
jgi:hypothetical protein